MTHTLSRLVLAGFLALVVSAQDPAREVLYAATGRLLTSYDVDPTSASLAQRSSVRLPANIQYAWPHPSRKYLYVAWSDGSAAADVPRGDHHGVSAFRIDPGTGALQQIGQTVPLKARPIHLSTDADGTHVLIAYNDPSSVTVHPLNADGTIGAMVNQPSRLDTGVYAHQVRVDASGKLAILVTRGNAATKDRPEDHGALKVFRYADGVLENQASIAPNQGVDFQPRHLDFHPTQPWVFVSLERQNKLQVYAITQDGSLSATPLYTKDSIAEPAHRTARQNAGAIHTHPNGNYVYQANRSSGDATGENSIAVYAIDSQTGEPTLIQNADTHGAEPRTFALDPRGRILVAANQVAVSTGSGKNVTTIPASLALFRVGDDGKLDFVRKYNIDTSAGSLYWVGIALLP